MKTSLTLTLCLLSLGLVAATQSAGAEQAAPPIALTPAMPPQAAAPANPQAPAKADIKTNTTKKKKTTSDMSGAHESAVPSGGMQVAAPPQKPDPNVSELFKSFHKDEAQPDEQATPAPAPAEDSQSGQPR